MALIRVDKLLQAAGGKGAGAVLLTSRENIRYFTGFTGEGMAVLSDRGLFVVTDSRYTEAAQGQAPGFEVVDFGPGKMPIVLADCVRRTGASTLGFEDEAMTVSDHRRLADELPGAEWAPLGSLGQRIRSVKDEEELDFIRRACRLTDEAFAHILSFVAEGATEQDVETEMTAFLGRCGARPAFDMIVAAGEHGSMPHAETGSRRIKAGELVTMDFGAMLGGYKADMTRTVAVGEPSAQMRAVYAVVREAQQAAQDAVRAGAACKAVDAVARDLIAKAGYGANFGHGLGHGVGLEIHEQPRLSPAGEGCLEAGMVVTVEPGIYLPGVGGVRIENTCIVREDGCEPLFAASRDLIVL